MRRSYLSHVRGDCIIGLPMTGDRFASTVSIEGAESLLRVFRRNAWEYAAKGYGASANNYLEFANELADALTDAAEQRAKFEAGASERSAA